MNEEELIQAIAQKINELNHLLRDAARRGIKVELDQMDVTGASMSVDAIMLQPSFSKVLRSDLLEQLKNAGRRPYPTTRE